MATGREIKFRAWDTETKELSYDFLDRSWLEVCIKSPYVELMQFTGVDDIYEGDIIEHMDSISLKAIISEVYWNERGYWALRKKNKNFENLLWRAENPRVIGNIYENAELLE